MISALRLRRARAVRERLPRAGRGGGTGDATVFLAEQLRATDARGRPPRLQQHEPGASRAGASRRAGCEHALRPRIAARPAGAWASAASTTSTAWACSTTCPTRTRGCGRCWAALAGDGALGLMVYGSVGRAGVYQMQELLRRALGERRRAAQARRAGEARSCAAVPRHPTAFKRGERPVLTDHRASDAGLADLLLHPQDRAYTVERAVRVARRPSRAAPRAHRRAARPLRLPAAPARWADAATPRRAHPRRCRAPSSTRSPSYLTGTDPDAFLLRDAHAAGRAATAMRTYVPFFFHEPLGRGRSSRQFLASGRGQPVVLDHKLHRGQRASCCTGAPRALRSSKRIDGRRSWREIFEAVRSDGAQASDAELFADFTPVYELLNAIDRLLLRTPRLGRDTAQGQPPASIRGCAGRRASQASLAPSPAPRRTPRASSRRGTIGLALELDEEQRSASSGDAQRRARGPRSPPPPPRARSPARRASPGSCRPPSPRRCRRPRGPRRPIAGAARTSARRAVLEALGDHAAHAARSGVSR